VPLAARAPSNHDTRSAATAKQRAGRRGRELFQSPTLTGSKMVIAC